MKLFGIFVAGAAAILALGALALLFMGCAESACYDSGRAAYTHERPTQPFHVTLADRRGVDSWTADGAPTVLTAHNPTGQYLQVVVKCWPSVPPTYIDYGLHNWWTCLPPHKEKHRLVEFMNVDAMTQVCRVVDQWPTSPDLCVEDDQ